jgi:hypothetical protein
VIPLFEGEKTTVFWIGLVVLAYSIYQFFSGFWFMFSFLIGYPFPIGDAYTFEIISERMM